MSTTKRVRLYGLIYPGWQESTFPPSFYHLPPASFEGSRIVAIEIDLPVLPYPDVEASAKVVEISETVPAA